MSTAIAYKVRVKLGQAEFDAEGPEETVKKNLTEFLEHAPAYADRTPTRQGFEFSDFLAQVRGPAMLDTVGVATAAAPQLPSTSLATSLNPQVLKRLFKDDSDDLISLRVLPSESEDKAADTVLLLLFGFLVLKNQSEVRASDLLTCAKQSGISLDRIDHAMAKQRYQSLIKRGGTRNGSRYALTNPGIQHAEDVAGKIFG
jgi:hypothetical protein